MVSFRLFLKAAPCLALRVRPHFPQSQGSWFLTLTVLLNFSLLHASPPAGPPPPHPNSPSSFLAPSSLESVPSFRKTPFALIFLSLNCPCSKSHESKLRDLQKSFPEVTFIGVHSNQDEPEAEARAYFEKAALGFEVGQDRQGRLAKELGALKTPHVFLYDKSGTLFYMGGVDDASLAENASKETFRSALTSLKEGKPLDPDQRRTRVLGCRILL